MSPGFNASTRSMASSRWSDFTSECQQTDRSVRRTNGIFPRKLFVILRSDKLNDKENNANGIFVEISPLISYAGEVEFTLYANVMV